MTVVSDYPEVVDLLYMATVASLACTATMFSNVIECKVVTHQVHLCALPVLSLSFCPSYVSFSLYILHLIRVVLSQVNV